MDSTENVTILFTDLVSSTALSSGLAPEAADEVRRAHFSMLRRAIASSGGAEVKNLGDGVMVAFSTASGALSCAVGMQQAVELDNRMSQRSTGLRVGLSGGDATKEGEDYFGDPVIEAARLCARAEGGQILASEVVRAMAGRRSPHQFHSVGALLLKGLPEPMDTVEIHWEPMGEKEPAPEVVALPSRLSQGPLVGVIGRELEAELLSNALKRVSALEGREVVLVSGEAGVGKTTLVGEAARRAYEAGACVLLGRCDQDLGMPYGPFVEALSHYVTKGPEDALAAHVKAYGAELGGLIPALAKRLGDLPARQSVDPDSERYLLFGAVIGLLAQVSADRPLVLVLDDLQWADKPSLQLLRHLVVSDELRQVLIVGTYRDSELSRTHPLLEVLAALRRQSGVSRLDVKGLDDTGVISFMQALAGHELGAEGVGLAHALYRETDGNPFFVGEVLRDLTETGAIRHEETGGWSAAGDLAEMVLPVSIREVVAARVARLGERAGRALTLASVIGREFDLELLARVSEYDEDDLIEILDGAASAALVRELSDVPGQYSFSHALVQHTLYQDLGATRRARAHHQVAEALEAICRGRPGQRVGELAHHWLIATQPVEVSKAISYAREAGEAALAALAPDEAVRYFSQALEVCSRQREPDPLLYIDLLLRLGNAQRQAGVPAFRETLLDAAHRAREVGAVDRLVAAALANTRWFFSALGVVDTDKVSVLEAALAALPAGDSTERARLLATLCDELTYASLEKRRSLGDEARAMARRLGDPATLVKVLHSVHLALNIPSTYEVRVREGSEALALAEALGDPIHLYWALSFNHANARQGGDFEQGAQVFSKMKSLSNRLREPTLLWMTAMQEATNAMLVGDTDRAEELATDALQIGNDGGQPDGVTLYGAQLMTIRTQQGRVGELLPLLIQVAAENPGVSGFDAALDLAYLDAGDETEARRRLDSAAADGFPLLHEDPGWLAAVVLYSLVAIGLEAVEPAKRLFDLLAPYDRQVPYQGVYVREPVAFYLGGLASVLGRYDEAERYFAEATELNIRGTMKYADAHANLMWGRMLAARARTGDLERARSLLQEARTKAATNGYAMIEVRANSALADLS